MNLSVVIITFNEEANLARTLASVQPLVADGKGEIIVVDSGSTDRTVEIAKSFGAKVFVEEWKGFAAQKNSAIDKATGDWILSLDADEEVEGNCRDDFTLLTSFRKPRPKEELLTAMEISDSARCKRLFVHRRNYFFGSLDSTWRILTRSQASSLSQRRGRFEDRIVHEDVFG